MRNVSTTGKNGLRKKIEVINKSREMILANLSMVSQIPAQTFHESERAQFIMERFTESGALEVKVDEMHNASAILEGGKDSPTVLIFAHMDNQFDAGTDQNISITNERASGAGVADDNIALATLLTIPDIIANMGIKPACRLILLATTRSHGRGDFEGIRRFVEKHSGVIDNAIYLNGTALGTVNYFTRSRFRCDVTCKMDTQFDPASMNIQGGSAILTINEIIDSILKIALPKKPWTNMNIGMISGGERYSTPSREASIHLEALSEDDALLDDLKNEVESRIVDVAAKHGANVKIDFFGHLRNSELTSRHPMVRNLIEILNELGHTPRVEHVNSEIAVTLAAGIPSVSLGITTGFGGSSQESYIDIAPISEGVLQVLTLLGRITEDCESRTCRVNN